MFQLQIPVGRNNPPLRRRLVRRQTRRHRLAVLDAARPGSTSRVETRSASSVDSSSASGLTPESQRHAPPGSSCHSTPRLTPSSPSRGEPRPASAFERQPSQCSSKRPITSRWIDASPPASQLWTRESTRALPSFHSTRTTEDVGLLPRGDTFSLPSCPHEEDDNRQGLQLR